MKKPAIAAPTVSGPYQKYFDQAYAALQKKDMDTVQSLVAKLSGAYKRARPEHKKELFNHLMKLHDDIDKSQQSE